MAYPLPFRRIERQTLQPKNSKLTKEKANVGPKRERSRIQRIQDDFAFNMRLQVKLT